jgi:hypothetical protein
MIVGRRKVGYDDILEEYLLIPGRRRRSGDVIMILPTANQ